MILRDKIIEVMEASERKKEIEWGANYIRKEFAWYCTWWFKFVIPLTTKEIRRELERMEKDKLIISDRSQSNNTKWQLVKYPTTK